MIERLLSAGERQPVVPVSACITTVDGHRRNNNPVVKGRGEGWQYLRWNQQRARRDRLLNFCHDERLPSPNTETHIIFIILRVNDSAEVDDCAVYVN